jgi:mannose-6-phosphate isomerase-like protein (cupin superfamily)
MAEPEMFQEPSQEEDRAGLRNYLHAKSPYQAFVEWENIPVYRDIIGVPDIRDLELGDWDRMGARGAYIRLNGLDDIKSLYALEIPGRSQTAVDHHIYHEFYLVIEGRGTLETWRDEKKKQILEWQPGSLFVLPPNVYHRLINATNERVLILATSNLPPIMNIFRDRNFVLNNDYQFDQYYSDDPDFYRYDEKHYAWELNKRAQTRTNFYPDIVNCELPLDNQRAPGYRRIQPGWRGLEDVYGGFISQYPPGRYSRAHRHGAGAVLVCLRGRGYTYSWHSSLGVTPWKDGFGDQVNELHYGPGGFVAAAPGGGDWFHQHFGVSRDYFRVINFENGPTQNIYNGGDERAVATSGNLTIREGGRSVGYSMEDPYVRAYFESELAKDGLTSQMPEELYKND